MDISTLGLAVDSRPVAQAEKALDSLAATGARADTTLGRATAHISKGIEQIGTQLADMGAQQRKAAAGVDTLNANFAELSANLRTVSAASAAAGKAIDVEAVATAAARSAAAGFATALEAQAAATMRSESAARAEAAALAATNRAVREATALRDSHVAAYRNHQAAADKYLQTLRTEAAEYGKTRAQIEAMRAAQMGLTAEQQKAAAAAGAQIDMMRTQQAQMGALGGAASGMAAAVAAGFAVERVHAFTRALFDASAANERVKTTLDFASGGNGAKELQYVAQMANVLGLELSSTAKAYGSMMAAARGTTLEGEGARKVFESVSKAAAVMGLSTEQSGGALLALQQMISKGTVQSEELRGQLGERLPGAFQTAARAMGVTTAELGKMLEQGLVPASEFLPKFAKQLETELGDNVDKAADRLDGSVNRFTNAWERLKRAGGDSGIARTYAEGAENAAGALNGMAAAMEIAAQNGEGFAGQTWALIKAMATMGNASERAKVDMVANAKATKEAEAELKRLQERGDNTSPNIYIRNSYVQLQDYLKELRAAKAAQDALMGIGVPGNTQTDVQREAAGKKQREAAKQEREAELKAYFEKDIRQTREQKITEEIAKARAANAAMMTKFEGDAATQAKLRAALEVEIGNIRTKNTPKGAAATAARDSVNAEIAEYQRGQAVQEEISRRTIANIAAQRAAGAIEEIEAIQQIAEVDAQRNAAAQTAIELQIESAQKKANNETQVANLEGQLALQKEKTLTREQQLKNDIAAIDQKRAENSRKLHNDEITSSTQELAALVAQNKAAALELEAIGLTDRQLQALTETRMDSVIARQQEKIAAMEMLDTEAESADAIDLERQKLEELNKARSLYSSGANRKRAVDQEQRMYANMWDSVDRSAHDAFVSIGESGMDAFDRIGKSLKASVFDMLYQMTVRKWLVSIGASITGSGFSAAANAATGGAAGSSMNLLGAVGNSPFGATAMGYVGNLGGFGAGAASAASEAALGSAFVGPSASAAGGAVGAGATFGAAIPYIGLALAALSLLGGKFKGETRTGGQFGVAFDGSVTNERRGQTYSYQGQQFDRDFSGGNRNALVSGQAYRLEGDPVAQESAIRGAVAGTAAGINAMLSALGSSAQVAGFSAGLETSGKNRGGVFAGGRLNTGALFGESGKGDNYAGTLYENTSTQSPDFQTALANFTLDLKQSTLQALQAATDIPKSVRDALANVDIEGLSEEQADAMLTTIGKQIEGVKNLTASFDAMGLDRFAAMGFDAAAAMAEVAGGFDKLQASVNSYYQNYYSESERAAILTEQLVDQFAALGFTLPRSREEFRALVQANEALGEAGAKTVASLLDLEDEFALITPAVNDATEALKKQRDSAYSSLQKAVSAERKALQERLSTAQEIENRLASIFDTLHSNVRELYGEMDDTREMLAQRGNDFIAKALAAAKATGALPDPQALAEAIADARSGLELDNYGGNQAERDYAALVLAGKLSNLETVAGKQLTDAQKTVRELENQSKQLDLTLDYWQQQIDIANGTYTGILSVEAAINNLGLTLGGNGTGKPGGANTTGGGTTPASGTGVAGRVGYGADEALQSFEKFKAWYKDVRMNADPSKLMDQGYQVPDWMRFHQVDADATDKEQFGSYLFFKNNPQYAKDLEQIYATGRSGYATDGSTLVRSDISKMPKEAQDFYQGNTAALLGAEAWGLDPVLSYQLYTHGPQQFGLDGKKQSFTEWLQTHKWTEQGLVDSNNVVAFGMADWQNYNSARWQTSTGNIIDTDGTIYTKEGKRVRMATAAEYSEVYGPGKKPPVQTTSDRDAYLNVIKANTDDLINKGWTAQQLADALVSTGTSMSDIAQAYGISVDQVRENLIAGGATNIPQYRQGTPFVPEDGPAFLHRGEMVVPEEFNPAIHGGGMDAAGLLNIATMLAAFKTAAEEGAANTTAIVELLRSVIDGNAVITAPAPEANIGV